MSGEGSFNSWQGFLTSMVSDGNNQSNDSLSTEDDLWVDSCLVQDPELSDNSWDAMKDALLDLISFDAPSDHNTFAADDDSRSSPDVLMKGEGEWKGKGSLETKFDHVPDKGHEIDDFTPVAEKEESELFRGFLQTNKSKPRVQKKGRRAKGGPDLSLADQREIPPAGIFKVWDLNTQVDVEDDLVNPLEKALADFRTEPSASGYSVDSVPDTGIVDDLISGLSDLSLHNYS